MPALLVFGARNLGRTIARELSRDGWSVTAVARTRDTIDALREELPHALALVGDATREEDVERAFAEAEVVVRRRLTNNRVAPAPLEGRVALSEFDPAFGRLVHHTASQLPHIHARSLGACLGLPLRKLRLVAPDIGGGFGAKLCFYAEDVICAFLSMRWLFASAAMGLSGGRE